jgi:hypothetical protein
MTEAEKKFREELEATGATIEAFIVRSPRDWFPDLYCYRIDRGGKVTVGNIAWDESTFTKILSVAKGN